MLKIKKKTKSNPYSWSTKGRIFDREFTELEKEIFENIILKHLEKAVNFKIIQNSSNGIVCYFELSENHTIFNKLFIKGKYILKLELATIHKIILLEKLSDLKLIPEIFLIDFVKKFGNSNTYSNTSPLSANNIARIPTIIIMEFIDGVDLEKLNLINEWEANKKDLNLRTYIWQNIEKEYTKWENLNIKHNDLVPKNIILTKDGKIVFIDPLIKEHISDDDGLLVCKYILLG